MGNKSTLIKVNDYLQKEVPCNDCLKYELMETSYYFGACVTFYCYNCLKTHSENNIVSKTTREKICPICYGDALLYDQCFYGNEAIRNTTSRRKTKMAERKHIHPAK